MEMENTGDKTLSGGAGPPLTAWKKALIVALGILTGAANGLLGGGGGIFAVPIITYLYGREEKQSHATAVLAVLPMTAISANIYILKGSLDWQLTWQVAIGATVGGILGAFCLKKVASAVLSCIFYALMTAAGVYMLCRALG